MTEPLRAGPDTRVTLHFSVRLMDGTEMDSTFGGQPASFVWGDESLLPGFERALLGLKAGDKRSVYIEADKGFGAYNPDNIQQFRQDEFAQDMTLETGVVVSFRDASGAELPGVIGAGLDERQRLFHFVGGDEVAFNLTAHAVLDGLHAPLQGVVADVQHVDGAPRQGAHMRDATAHLAGADDADLLNLIRHYFLISTLRCARPRSGLYAGIRLFALAQ